jgi:hypothetical protein
MRIRRLFGWVGIVVVAALGVTVILLHNNAVQQWSLRRLENIARAQGINFSAQHIYLDPYKLQATLDGVVYVENGTSLRASRVTIHLPWSVFTSAVKEITSLEIDNLEIKLNSAETLVPSPSGKPTPLPRFRFDRLIVRNGSLDYRNQVHGIPDSRILAGRQSRKGIAAIQSKAFPSPGPLDGNQRNPIGAFG